MKTQMLKYLLLIVLGLSFPHFSAKAQKSGIDFDTIREVKYFDIDILGQVMVINKHDELSIINPIQKRAVPYQNDILGKLSQVDITNPQRICLFYYDNQTIVFLDDALSETMLIDLGDWAYYDISAIAVSNDNGFWLYNEVDQNIIKVNDQGKLQTKSLDFRDINMADAKVIQMKERNNELYLLTENYGLLIFDNFGQYVKTIPYLKGVNDIQYLKNRMVYVRKGEGATFDKKALEENTLQLGTNILQLKIWEKQAYILNHQAQLYISKPTR